MRPSDFSSAILTILGGFLSLLIAGQPGAAQSAEAGPLLEPRPDWVDYRMLEAPPEKAPDGVSGGLYYLLYDLQHRVEDDRVLRYRHTAWQITNEAGLSEGSRLSLDFDPSFQQLIVHSLNIIRDGEVLPQLSEETFTTIRREPDLQAGMVDGDLTSFTELRGVQVGDVVEFDITMVNQGGVWPGGYAAEQAVQWSVPLREQFHRVILPDSQTLTMHPWLGAPEPEITSANGLTDHVWSFDNPPPVQSQAATPSGYPLAARLSLSNMTDWRDVVEWAEPIYPRGLALPAETEARIAAIMSEYADGNERITAASRFVQDEIRYVADEVGLGSHFPRSPEDVIARGYGDCKDKALLLVTMLEAMGYEADVAFADLDSGYHLENVAPSPFAFDHLIVRVRLDGNDYWIDATRTNQGGLLEDMAVPAYGYVLPVADDSDALVLLEPGVTATPTTEMVETFDLAGMDDTGIGLSVITTYTGRDADGFRASLAGGSMSGLAQNYLNYYREYYPQIAATEALSVEDDRDSNTIRVEEAYFLSQEAFELDGLRENFPARGDLVLNQVNDVDTVDRTAPVGLVFPFHRRHSVSFVNAPYDMTGLADVTIDEPFARYTSRTETRRNGLTVSFELQTLTPSIPVESAAQSNTLYNQIWATADLSFTLTPYTALDGFWSAFAGVDDATLGVLLALGIYLLALLGVPLAFARDKRLPETAIFYPVGLVKFSLMSLATFNLYQVMWMWRNWRWVKRADDLNISPFGRSLFGVFFFAALFSEIKKRAGKGRGLPMFVGTVIAIVYMIWAFTARVADRVAENTLGADDAMLGWIMLFGLASFLPMLPIVNMVNGMNRDHPEVIRFTSRIMIRDVIMMLYGFAFLALAVIGSFGLLM